MYSKIYVCLFNSKSKFAKLIHINPFEALVTYLPYKNIQKHLHILFIIKILVI